MILKFVDGVEVLHNKYLTGCNFSYLQDFELREGKKRATVFLFILHLRHIQHFLAHWN